jgi:hypothetical protein
MAGASAAHLLLPTRRSLTLILVRYPQRTDTLGHPPTVDAKAYSDATHAFRSASDPPAQHIPQHDSCAGAQGSHPATRHESHCVVHSSVACTCPLSSLSLSPRLTLSLPGLRAARKRLFEHAQLVARASACPTHVPRSNHLELPPTSPGLRQLSKMSGRVRDHSARRESLERVRTVVSHRRRRPLPACSARSPSDELSRGMLRS